MKINLYYDEKTAMWWGYYDDLPEMVASYPKYEDVVMSLVKNRDAVIEDMKNTKNGIR